MTYKELENKVKNLEKLLNSHIAVPSQNDVIEKKLRNLTSFSQQRAHLTHTTVPDISVGIPAELRIIDDGTNFKVILKSKNNGWKQSSNFT